MLADQPTVLAEFDPVGIGADLNRAADRVGGDRGAPGRSWRRMPAPHGTRRSVRHREPGLADPPRSPNSLSGRGTNSGWRRAFVPSCDSEPEVSDKAIADNRLQRNRLVTNDAGRCNLASSQQIKHGA